MGHHTRDRSDGIHVLADENDTISCLFTDHKNSVDTVFGCGSLSHVKSSRRSEVALLVLVGLPTAARQM
jgi:hypothetical protein